MDEMLCSSQFVLMNADEMQLIDGGGIISDAICGVCACVLIAVGGVATIVGVGTAIGTGGAGAIPGVKLATAGVSCVTAGAKILHNLYN